jgi:hypothetical protein
MKTSSVTDLRTAQLQITSKLTQPLCPRTASAPIHPATNLFRLARGLPLPHPSKRGNPLQRVGNPLAHIASALPSGYFPL